MDIWSEGVECTSKVREQYEIRNHDCLRQVNCIISTNNRLLEMHRIMLEHMVLKQYEQNMRHTGRS